MYEQTTLIIPCAGESSRFPNLRPKWQLTQPNGMMMAFDSIKKINLENVEKIVLIVLRDHLKENLNLIEQSFKKLNTNKNIDFFILDEKTKSQPETVARYLQSVERDFSFFVKDCDNQFDASPSCSNEVVISDVSNIPGNNISSKSYVIINDSGQVASIVEKSVISNNFCVGGYSFRSSKEYLKSFNILKNFDNLYISHIISHMILTQGIVFSGINCSSYEDWGTIEDWLQYKSSFMTLFLDIDGVLFYNSSEYIAPQWGTTQAIKNNIEYIKKLQSSGKVQTVITTSRSSEFSNITEQQLKEAGISYEYILYGMLHAKRIIVNDYSKSNPHPSCNSICILRDSDNLEENFLLKKI